MRPQIRYAEDVVVATLFQGKWEWYVTEKEFWVLDYVLWEARFRARGIPVYSEIGGPRKGIPILNENTVTIFLPRISEFKVNHKVLQELLREQLPVYATLGEIVELFPALLVDFDHQKLWSVFQEPTHFEEYVPSGWVGKYEDFYELIPWSERYWVIDGHNYLKELSD